MKKQYLFIIKNILMWTQVLLVYQLWSYNIGKNSSKNDKRLFQDILDLIQNGKYDISLFPDEDKL